MGASEIPHMTYQQYRTARSGYFFYTSARFFLAHVRLLRFTRSAAQVEQ